MNNILKTSLLLSILFFFGCNNSNEQNDIQQLDCLSSGLQNGVVAFYPFNNGSINDESGNSNNLINTTSASATADRNGNMNCAFSFISSNNEFLKFTNPTFLDDLPANGISISFWYKSNNQDNGVFISRDEGPQCWNREGQWSIQHVNNVIIFSINEDNSIIYGVETSTWEHIVIKAIGNDLELYKNGILSATGGSDIECDPPNPTLNQGDLFFGKFFDGQMDDIIIYDRLLSQTEITELFTLSPCCN
ncbi:LamG domain-containing protein [Psychroserpens mesophilus]|uniref:LamG domain-containing protein n=1 Tax=Psychroserpens mesophilus TaxID=325473 RepID=UPI00058ECE5A|nr:LamG domain-containing protein [Psychroserpens mesophilus]